MFVNSKELQGVKSVSGRIIFDYAMKEFAGRGFGSPKGDWIGSPSAYKILCQEKSFTGLALVHASTISQNPSMNWSECLEKFSAKKITTAVGDVYLASPAQPPSSANTRFLEIVDEAVEP
jgi:hypothetical protein